MEYPLNNIKTYTRALSINNRETDAFIFISIRNDTIVVVIIDYRRFMKII